MTHPVARPIRRTALVATLVAALALAACGDDDGGGAAPGTSAAPTTTVAPADDLRINQLQVIGTHNSFHLPLAEEERPLLEAMSAQKTGERLYAHRPIGEQLAEQQVRQLELDVYVDTEGGRYADPVLRRQAGLDPYVDEVPEMAEPGTKVLHEQDVDYRTVCPTLVACLTEVRDWSDANPDHVPVAIHIQFKDGRLIFPVEDQAVPERWSGARMDDLDAEITSVFGPDRIITPDDVRGDHETLEQAILTDGWPTLGESRGKVLFLMVNPEPYRTVYLHGHEGLAGRILFTNAEPGQPDASYIGLDDPVADGDRIDDLVGRGYLVRTRADSPETEGRSGDTTRRDAALASGAHWISTDHPTPDGEPEDDGSDYSAALPGGLAARCNPVTAPAGCRDEAVEP